MDKKLISGYPLSGMITVPVSASTYQAVVASMNQNGGITLHPANEASLTGAAAAQGNAIQLIGGSPLQLANGQIIATKVEPPDQHMEAARHHQSSIQNLVTKVMGEQSIHNDASKPATLTITPVRSGPNPGGASISTPGQVIHMISGHRARGSREQNDQPDTTESLD